MLRVLRYVLLPVLTALGLGALHTVFWSSTGAYLDV